MCVTGQLYDDGRRSSLSLFLSRLRDARVWWSRRKNQGKYLVLLRSIWLYVLTCTSREAVCEALRVIERMVG